MIKKITSLLLIFLIIFSVVIPTNIFGIEKNSSKNCSKDTTQSCLDENNEIGYHDFLKLEKFITSAEFIKMSIITLNKEIKKTDYFDLLIDKEGTTVGSNNTTCDVPLAEHPVQQTDLTTYYELLDAVSKSDYIVESWKIYKTVVAANVVNSKNTQAEVNATIKIIQEAQSNLIEKKLDLNNKTIKILTIGNSFSEDATRWICEIAESAGINVIIGNIYFSGCSLENHWTNAINNNEIYTYYKLTSSTMTNTAKQTMKDCILDEEWDFITFQQSSGCSGIYTTFQPYLNNLITYIKGLSTNHDVKLALNMTWAYATNSHHESFINYNRNQATMFNAIIYANQQAIAETSINIIIPCGTAIQNARANKYLNAVGDELTRDGHHLDLGIGRYIAGLTFFETLIVNSGNVKKDLFEDITYIPNTYTSDEKLAHLAKTAVKNAISNPYKVTAFQK